MPTTELEHRDAVRELLEREDMMKRRAKLDIPEFYVGTIFYNEHRKMKAGKSHNDVHDCFGCWLPIIWWLLIA